MEKTKIDASDALKLAKELRERRQFLKTLSAGVGTLGLGSLGEVNVAMAQTCPVEEGPAWRTAMSPWQWVALDSASIKNVGPSFNSGATLVGGSRRSRIDAWNGMAAIGTSVYLAGVGGHADWAGNEAYQCQLAAANPAWVMLRPPTPDSQVVIDAAYYLDGRPTSSHTYYALHGDALRNKIFRLGIGSGYGSGNFSRPIVDAFDLARADWDAANTWPSVPDNTGLGKAQTQHPTTGDTYVFADVFLWRFNRASATWSKLAAIPQNGSAAYYRAAVVDTARNRIVVLGDEYRVPTGVLIYDMATNTWTNNRNLSGLYAEIVAARAGNCACYQPVLDRYIVKTSVKADVIQVDPVTLATSPLATSGGSNVPDAINGVFGKFVSMPSLNGYAYQPHGEASLWFLAAA